MDFANYLRCGEGWGEEGEESEGEDAGEGDGEGAWEGHIW